MKLNSQMRGPINNAKTEFTLLEKLMVRTGGQRLQKLSEKFQMFKRLFFVQSNTNTQFGMKYFMAGHW